MAAATVMAPIKPLTKTQKKKLETGPIREIQGYINTFTTHFCRQYGFLHWQEDVASECMMKWWKATEIHPEKMESPQYAKRVIYNAAIQWEKKHRAENHHSELVNEGDGQDVFTSVTMTAATPVPEFSLDLGGLSDVESLILEFHYGFGRGEEGSMSLLQIARKMGRSETWVRQRHAKALKIVEASLLR